MKGTDSNNSARHQAHVLDCPAKCPSSGLSPEINRSDIIFTKLFQIQYQYRQNRSGTSVSPSGVGDNSDLKLSFGLSTKLKTKRLTQNLTNISTQTKHKTVSAASERRYTSRKLTKKNTSISSLFLRFELIDFFSFFEM